jgi:hypothetical protein
LLLLEASKCGLVLSMTLLDGDPKLPHFVSMRRLGTVVLACLAATVACGEQPNYERVLARAAQVASSEESARVHYTTSMQLPDDAGR